MTLAILLFAATYGIQMRGNLIDKSELIDEELPAASVPGNGSNTTARLDANLRTAMWAIHEGYLQRALVGAANADAATPWNSSTNLLNRQACSRRIVRPGSRALAGVLGNPNLDIGTFENAFHPSGSQGLVWSTSHFADGTWPGVNTQPTLPTGTYDLSGLIALHTNGLDSALSPIQRLSSLTGDCNQITRQFYHNCSTAAGGILIDVPDPIYGHYPLAYLLPTNSPGWAQALEHPSRRLDKRELDALNAVVSPLNILCQYQDAATKPLQTNFEYIPSRREVTHHFLYSANTSNAFSRIVVDFQTDPYHVTLQPGELSFGAPVTNWYTYVNLSNDTSRLDCPRIAVEPTGGNSQLLSTPPIVWKLRAFMLDIMNTVYDMYNAGDYYGDSFPSNGWSCTFSLDFKIINGIRTPVALLYGFDRFGNYHQGSEYIGLHPDPDPILSPFVRYAYNRCETLDSSIGDYDSANSSRLVQEGYLPATPSIHQYTQGATVLILSNNEERINFHLATASPQVSPAAARSTVKSAWQLLLASLRSAMEGAAGYRPDDPSTVIGDDPPQARAPLEIVGTGNVHYLAGHQQLLYTTNYLVRLTGPGVECTAIMYDDGTISDATIVKADYPGLPNAAWYDARTDSDIDGPFIFFEGYQSSESAISRYPSGWPEEYRATFEAMYRQYPRNWRAVTDKGIAVRTINDADGTPTIRSARSSTDRHIYNATTGDGLSCGSTNTDISGFYVETSVHSLVPHSNPARGVIWARDGDFYIDNETTSVSWGETYPQMGEMDATVDLGGTDDILIPPAGGPTSGECRMFFIQVLDFSQNQHNFSNWQESP